MQTGCVIACEGMQEKQGVVHGNDDDKGRKKNEINCVNFGRQWESVLSREGDIL